MPLALRLAGCWLLWSAWCSLSGWGLSAVNQLSGLGHLAALPLLLAAIWFWLKKTASSPNNFSNFAKWRRRLFRRLPLIYLTIAGLSLLAALVNPNPWSFDSMTYRLPRVLYWWSAHHWYWIGTLDHRLDFSSAGFEWQMLPLLELTHSSRFLFLLNWIPFLLLPWLVFLAFRALGVNGRSARRWMWLLPSGYCIALQCSGLQNDGYSVNYLLAAIAFAVSTFHSRRAAGLWFAMLATALLTGAKVSNLPLLLPLGVLLLPLLVRVPWLNWRLPVVLIAAIFCSFLPLTFLAWQNTGDWAGDPTDQWNVKTHGATGGLAANVILLARDATQPPLLPGSQRVNAALEKFNQSAFADWLRQSHGEFSRVRYGEMAYEGPAGPGFGLAFYVALLIAGIWFVKTTATEASGSSASLALPVRLAPWLAWLAYAVYLVKLGSDHSPRIAAPFYPLLLVTLLRCPRVAALERKKISGVLAGLAAATVIPIIILTPARPLIPVSAIAGISHSTAINKIAEEYHFWDSLRDDLAPLREKLPHGVTRLGYAGGFHDTAYGLWQPLGSRVIVELGLPPGSHAALPPPDLTYAVVTERGIRERYQFNLATWLTRTDGEIIFTYPHNVMLDAHSPPKYESWYLVKLNPPATRHSDTPHESAP
jgi:hypothetical protein